MRKFKKVPAIVLAASMCLAAVGCGQSPVAGNSAPEAKPAGTEENSDGTSGGEVTLNFWHHYSAQSPENETLTKVLIPKFEEENPGIKVNAVSHEWADLHDKILISAKSDTLPDVARLDSAWVPEFQQMGILTPLQMEMPDYLKEAGIEPPRTMDEFVEDCKKLSGENKDGQQVWGYDEPGLSGWNLCPFIWSMGGSLLNEDQTKASGYINSPETVAAVQMFADLAKDNAITGWNSGDIPMTDGFGTGRYMMLLEGPWKVSEMAGAYPDFNYATAPVPAGKGGSISVLGGEDIGMFTSAHKEEAWKFMKFMTSEYAQEEMAKCGQIPVNKEAMESDTVKNADFAPYIEQLKTAKSRPTVSCWTEIDGELSAAVTEVVNGNKTAQEAMDELAVKVDDLLVH